MLRLQTKDPTLGWEECLLTLSWNNFCHLRKRSTSQRISWSSTVAMYCNLGLLTVLLRTSACNYILRIILFFKGICVRFKTTYCIEKKKQVTIINQRKWHQIFMYSQDIFYALYYMVPVFSSTPQNGNAPHTSKSLTFSTNNSLWH